MHSFLAYDASVSINSQAYIMHLFSHIRRVSCICVLMDLCVHVFAFQEYVHYHILISKPMFSVNFPLKLNSINM